MTEVPEWLDEEAAAAWLAIPVDVVREAVRAGAIPALHVGPFVRISRSALIEAARGAPPKSSPEPAEQDEDDWASDERVSAALTRPSFRGGLPTPAGLRWASDLADDAPFTYIWPQPKGQRLEERYDRVWTGEIVLHERPIAVRVGEGVRQGRGRLVVFFDRAPICEFVETRDGRWASLIKPDGKKSLSPEATPPPLYRATEVAPYREVTDMRGSGVPKSLAVVLPRDDRESAVHHAAARWLGRRGLPLRPAD